MFASFHAKFFSNAIREGDLCVTVPFFAAVPLLYKSQGSGSDFFDQTACYKLQMVVSFTHLGVPEPDKKFFRMLVVTIMLMKLLKRQWYSCAQNFGRRTASSSSFTVIDS